MFAHAPTTDRQRSSGPGDGPRAMARAAAPVARPVPGCACGGHCPRCRAGGGLHVTGGPIVQRQPLDDTAPPAATWSPDLIWILVDSDRLDCNGFASPVEASPYSDCGARVTPPFCQSARVPFGVKFFVDRVNAPIAQPFTAPKLRVRMQFHTTGGRRTLDTDVSDPSPRYVAPNEPLATSFGQDFPVGSSESGRLTMRIEMIGVRGHDVLYTDTIEYVITPCT